jgi:PAS domain S-box-containing protein
LFIEGAPKNTRGLESYIEMALFRHGAERRLRQSEERLRMRLGSIGDAVVASDTSGNVTYMNPVAVLLTGWKAKEANGQPLNRVDAFNTLMVGRELRMVEPKKEVDELCRKYGEPERYGYKTPPKIVPEPAPGLP